MVLREEPVRIAGAGPAGLSCAIALARAGRSVVVFEERASPAGDSADGYELLENWTDGEDSLSLVEDLGVALGEPPWPVSDAELLDDTLRATRVSSARPFGYFVRRGDSAGSLDAALTARALGLGVVIRFGERREAPEVDVLATGARNSALAWKQVTFRTDSPARVQFLLDPARTPAGYAWLAVRDSVGILGCLTGRDGRHLDRHFEGCLQRFRRISDFSITISGTRRGGVDCLVSESPQIGATRVVGGAAGSRDLLFGLGLRGAMDDGRLAAKSLIEKKSFDALREERVGPAIRTSLALRYRFERTSDAALRRRLARCARGDFRERLRRCARPSFAKEVLALAARAAWRSPQSCAHPLREHWCREVETQTA